MSTTPESKAGPKESITILTSRRGLIFGAGALLIAAPAIVRFQSIMPVRSLRRGCVTLPASLRDGDHMVIQNWANSALDVFLPSDTFPIARLRPGDELSALGGAEGSYLVISASWGGPEHGIVIKDLVAIGP